MRVDVYRRRMRERGFRQIQLWVPDVRSSRFDDEARRQSTLVAAADARSDDQEFVEAVSTGWDE